MKSPAFSLYVRDWLCSKTISKLHSKGPSKGVSAYLYLLCSSWLEEPPATLPSDDSELAGLARVSLQEWEEIKPLLMPQFKRFNDTRIYNERLMAEWEKQQKRRFAGSKGGSKTQSKRVAASEDEIEEVQISTGRGEGGGGTGIEYLRTKICALFSRNTNERWPYDEERLLVQIFKRPEWEKEISEIVTYRNKPESRPRQTVLSLFQNWQSELDKCRTYIPPQPPIHIRIKALEDEIDNHRANQQSASHNRNATDLDRADLQAKRLKLKEMKNGS